VLSPDPQLLPSRPTPSEAKGGSPYEKESKAFYSMKLKNKFILGVYLESQDLI
jgi:hypothetical protein